MLITIKQKGFLSKDSLAEILGSSDKTIQVWRSNYIKGGVEQMIKDKRGVTRKAAISTAAHRALSSRLKNPKEGFRSFIEVQQWLTTEFGIEMNYHAVNKYVKRKFGARLKVSRKSHVLKTPADEAVFKKSIR